MIINITHKERTVIDQRATGAAIREARNERRVTQYQLAKAIKKTKAYVSLLELGKGNITEAKVRQIEKALDKLWTKQLEAEANAACDPGMSDVQRAGFVKGYVAAAKNE